MSESTVQQVFGANATLSTTVLSIQLSDLVAVGFDPAAFFTAEGLLVAVLLKAALVLTEASRTGDYANRNVTIYSGGTDLPVQGGSIYRRDAYSVLLYKPETILPVNPNDY